MAKYLDEPKPIFYLDKRLNVFNHEFIVEQIRAVILSETKTSYYIKLLEPSRTHLPYDCIWVRKVNTKPREKNK